MKDATFHYLVGDPDDIELFVNKETYEQWHKCKITSKDLAEHYCNTWDSKTILKFGSMGIILTKEDVKEIKSNPFDTALGYLI